MPVNEFNYIGELPAGIVADYHTAKEFADDLAAQVNLKIISEYTNNWGDGGDISLIPNFKSSFNGKNITVSIFPGLSSMQEFHVLVNGDVDDPNAQAIAAKAEELFAKKYPGYKLERFIRYQGLAP